MDREQILAMKPGRELDALVAEKVMGYEVEDKKSIWAINDTGLVRTIKMPPRFEGDCFCWLPEEFYRPSTNIAAAWEVVEKMKNRVDSAFGYHLCNVCSVDPRCDRYDEPTFAADLIVESLMENLSPEAICKAALLAVMDNV